jgi:hypothetical protein
MTSRLAFNWFATALVFCVSGCNQKGYELNRQRLELTHDKMSITFNLLEIVDTHEIRLWSADPHAANELFDQMDIERSTVLSRVTGEKWSFIRFNPDQHNGLGRTLPGSVPLGYVNGRGSATLTIPLKKNSALDKAILTKVDAVIFVSPRQSGL